MVSFCTVDDFLKTFSSSFRARKSHAICTDCKGFFQFCDCTVQKAILIFMSINGFLLPFLRNVKSVLFFFVCLYLISRIFSTMGGWYVF